MLQRHATDYWIRNRSIDVSIKELIGPVTVHWHEFYEIELILSGGGTYHIDGIDYEIRPGCLFVMSPSSFHKIIFRENTKLINLMFTVDMCDADYLCQIFGEEPHRMLTLPDSEVCFFHILAKDMVSNLQDSVRYLSQELNCILGKIGMLAGKRTEGLHNSSVQYALLYLQNHFTENISLEDAAKIANYAPNYFGNRFKEYTGVPFKRYLTNLRFSFAEKLLLNSDLSITQICYRAGFGDYSNFVSEFKKRHGVSPRTYRKSFPDCI